MAWNDKDYYVRREAAVKHAKATATAAADAAVKRLASVGRHLSKDDLDEVRETEYDKVFRDEMDAFEMDESNARYEAMMAEEREFPRRRNAFWLEEIGDMVMNDDADSCYDDLDYPPPPLDNVLAPQFEDEPCDGHCDAFCPGDACGRRR